jgi:hypothetical protein
MKFKIGDLVKVVNVRHDCKGHLLGKKYTIRNVFNGVGKGGIYDVGDDYLLNEEELELATSKFKVGDQVRIIAANNCQNPELIGNVYKVTIVQDNMDWYHLEDPMKYAWKEDELELVKPKFDHKNYLGKYAMHCQKEDDAYTFCRYLHSVGKKWITDRTYIETQHFHSLAGGTVYFFNDGTCSSYTDHLKFNDGTYELLNFEDFDWSDFIMKKKFTKADLKNGDFVKCRDGDIGIVLADIGAIYFGRQYGRITDINDYLTASKNHDCDIMAVRRPHAVSDCTFDIFTSKRGELVYERKEVEEMTLEEVCKALGKDIKIVKGDK